MKTQCNICHKTNNEGKPHYNINFHREQLIENAVTVDFVETLLTMCISCRMSVNRDSIMKVLSTKDGDKARLLGELLIPKKVR